MNMRFIKQAGMKTIMAILVAITLALGNSDCRAKDYAPFLNEYLTGKDGQPPYQHGSLNNYLPNPALITGDYFAYYGLSEYDLTPLKRQMLMQSEEYQEKFNRMNEEREKVANSYCHYKVEFYRPVYDLQKGGFELILEKGFNKNYYDPFLIVIPDYMSNIVKRNKNGYLEFFVPISNLEEAVKIEDKYDYGVAIRFNYMPCEKIVESNDEDNYYKREPVLGNMIFELNDIILYKKSSGEIVWTALLGDYSEGLRSKEELKYGNSKSTPLTPDRGEVFTAVERPAQFPGGDAKRTQWLSSHVRYPEMAQQNGVQGRVIVKFIVEKDGKISSPSIVKGVDEDLDREAMRVVMAMPKWQPATNNGKPVNSYFTMPVIFKLQNQ